MNRTPSGRFLILQVCTERIVSTLFQDQEKLRIKVKYLSLLSLIVGASEQEFHLPAGATVRMLIERISSTYECELKKSHIDLHKDIMITLNNELLKPKEEAALRDGDAVVLLTAIAGG